MMDILRIGAVRCGALGAAALLSLVATGASAEEVAEPPVGIVENPCIGAPVLPVVVRDYFRGIMDPALSTGAAMPAAEYAGYRTAADEHKKRDWAALCYYRADNARVAALPQDERRVVYIGDSITELWGVAAGDFFRDGRINRGISGQTGEGMVVRFVADVVALKPRMVHILAGTNDIAGNDGARSEQDLRNNIIAMASIARANGIAVVLASLPPAAAFPWRPGIKPAAQIRAHNRWLADYARQTGAVFVDYYSLLATEEGAMQPALTFDGVHLNAAGYRKIEALSRAATR
ncbi:lysophospholipase L1-like esterase [Sphingopyxis panaciterrae]|uniref:GDSL-type esterase/lipase family protein n=1 Tax=Sphingopyxis panaciterrae TaxID=363841 RepID=UPI001423DFAC|nr:GDSL-type esterase/lipase family protein [Sphingopyxis panaciterrae]NIJ35863.1 lysophospholipase L1-like esterase [Sphingopyxis panaciterrae]